MVNAKEMAQAFDPRNHPEVMAGLYCQLPASYAAHVNLVYIIIPLTSTIPIRLYETFPYLKLT